VSASATPTRPSKYVALPLDKAPEPAEDDSGIPLLESSESQTRSRSQSEPQLSKLSLAAADEPNTLEPEPQTPRESAAAAPSNSQQQQPVNKSQSLSSGRMGLWRYGPLSESKSEPLPRPVHVSGEVFWDEAADVAEAVAASQSLHGPDATTTGPGRTWGRPSGRPRGGWGDRPRGSRPGGGWGGGRGSGRGGRGGWCGQRMQTEGAQKEEEEEEEGETIQYGSGSGSGPGSAYGFTYGGTSYSEITPHQFGDWTVVKKKKKKGGKAYLVLST